MNRFVRFRARVAAAALTAAAAISVATAPTASADIEQLTIVPLGAGAGYGTGCTYLLVARTDEWNGGVSFADVGGKGDFLPQDYFSDRKQIYLAPVINRHAYALWTPTSVGTHTLTAYQTSAGGPIRTVIVKPGIPVGPACIVR